MKGIFFLVFLALVSVLGVFSATIFDGRRGGRRMALKLRAMKPLGTSKFDPNDESKRHINTLRLPDVTAVEKVRREMKKRIVKQEDKSDERNIWRSHPQLKDYKGPDTTEAVGLDIN